MSLLFVLLTFSGCHPAAEQSTGSNGEPGSQAIQHTATQASAEPVQERKQVASATGSVQGTVIYEDDPKRRWRYSRYYIKDRKTGHLAEAVVALRGSKLKESAPSIEPQTHVIDQKDTRFLPETTAIRAGESVKFTNSDPILHNVYSSNPLKKFDDSIKMGDSFTQTFDRAGGIARPIVLGCRFHSVMQAWIFVFDHPWFALTGETGRFRWKDVPAGSYQLEMVHPAGALEWRKSVEIKAGETTEIAIRVSPDRKN